jgi:uncharacterized membrane protein
MNLETSKTLGGIGALLMFLGIFPYISTMGIVEIVGIILVLIGLYGIGNFYRERSIFNNAIYGVISAVIGVVIAVAVAFTVFLTSFSDFLQQIYPEWDGTWSSISSLQSMTPNTNFDPAAILPFLTGFLLIIVVVWIFSVISTFFVRRSLREVSVRSGTGLFSTAGLLLLIGAVLIIIFGLGLLLMWIAALLLAIAFFTMKTGEPVPSTYVTSSPPTPPAPTSV